MKHAVGKESVFFRYKFQIVEKSLELGYTKPDDSIQTAHQILKGQMFPSSVEPNAALQPQLMLLDLCEMKFFSAYSKAKYMSSSHSVEAIIKTSDKICLFLFIYCCENSL